MLTLALALMPNAAACGGFFCNTIDPVEQEGEVIVFEVDAQADLTTMHVQVSYQGPPTEFAWIVPVKGQPDLFTSNDLLFERLASTTAPRFNLQTQWGECDVQWDFFDADSDGLAVPAQAPENDNGVVVLDQQQVGPYDTVTLSATDSQSLITWLQENDYAIPNTLTDVVAPYVAEDHNFVALRLTSGSSVGDLKPLGLTYQGTEPAIPIQLTSVAATDDMQLVTFVLGDERAVPLNYLHVELNESDVNWFRGGSDYLDVLSRAADEASGRAFTTEFAGSTDRFENTFHQSFRDELDLDGVQTSSDFVRLVTQQAGLQATADLLSFLETHAPPPAGIDSQSYYNCPDCFEGEASFDRASALAAFESDLIGPLRDIQAMFDRTTVITRLGSTMSADEMTVDPVFGFNPDLSADVSNIHTAELHYECDSSGSANFQDIPKTLVLANGDEIGIPSDRVLAEMGMDDASYLDTLVNPSAERIEMLGLAGQPEVLFDARAEITDNIADFNGESRRLTRTGCSNTSGNATWLLAFAPLLLGLRRR